MAGFVPGRDRVTIEALAPEEMRRKRELEDAERRAGLDQAELAELERAQIGAPAPSRKRSLLDRLLRRP
jgi:hypothetical protein